MVEDWEARLSDEVGVEGIYGHLHGKQPGDLSRRGLAQHRPKGDHGRTGGKGAVNQEWQVQLDE